MRARLLVSALVGLALPIGLGLAVYVSAAPPLASPPVAPAITTRALAQPSSTVAVATRERSDTRATTSDDRTTTSDERGGDDGSGSSGSGSDNSGPGGGGSSGSDSSGSGSSGSGSSGSGSSGSGGGDD